MSETEDWMKLQKKLSAIPKLNTLCRVWTSMETEEFYFFLWGEHRGRKTTDQRVLCT